MLGNFFSDDAWHVHHDSGTSLCLAARESIEIDRGIEEREVSANRPIEFPMHREHD
jgi:hypothetical protein